MKPPIRAIARAHPRLPARRYRNATQTCTPSIKSKDLVVRRMAFAGRTTSSGHPWKRFLRELFQSRPRGAPAPGYFPFVEPGFEFDIRCPF
jgi:phenylalanyl-tRNA synthetase alpha subunit